MRQSSQDVDTRRGLSLGRRVRRNGCVTKDTSTAQTPKETTGTGGEGGPTSSVEGDGLVYGTRVKKTIP